MKLNETNRTLIYIGVAIVSVGAASLTHFVTRPRPDAEYQGVGGEFYKDFTDPTAAQVLRVVAYDKDTASVKIFKVDYRDGKWRIPSHHDYPADGKDRLARTAASVIGTSKNALVSRNKSQQVKYDVVDPEDPDPTILSGRGQKITISKNDGTVLAEFVVGKQAENQPDVYYVRGTKSEDPNAIYLAKLKIDLSTKFGDWIEPDLLKIDRDKLTDIRSDNYSIDETQGVLIPGEITELERKSSSDPWKLVGLKDKTEELKTDTVLQIANNIDGIRLIGVRPKPQGINPDLTIDKKIVDSRELAAVLLGDMAARGFYIASDQRGGQKKLVSKEGEFEAGTSEGILYDFPFGKIFTGTEFDIETGLPKTANKSKDAKKGADAKGGPADGKANEKAKGPEKKGRYLMVYAAFDPKLVGDSPKKPSEPKKPNGLVRDTPSKSGSAANQQAGHKQLSKNPRDGEMMALADPKAEAKADAKSATTDKSGAKSPKAKGPEAKKPAVPVKPPVKPDPKAEYEKAMSQYKKDLERYENDKSEFEKKLKKGQEKVKELNDRFGPWYYVISAESFENLRLTHASLVKPKEAPGAKKEGPAIPAHGIPGFPGQ
jgi:hypothetical protein